MRKSVIGIFNSVDDVNALLETLEDAGYTADDVSIVTREDIVEPKEVSVENDASQGITEAAKTGGLIGGVLGLLAGVGALTIPGIGALFVTGPIAAALGLTGVVGATATGALTGALAGGLIGALKELGVDEPMARTYEERVKNGSVLVGVLAQEDEEDDVERLMEDSGAESVANYQLKLR